MSKAQLRRLFNRCCGYLSKGNAIAVYDEVLPLLRRYKNLDAEAPEEIQALMASCALLDSMRAGVKLDTANIVQITQERVGANT